MSLLDILRKKKSVETDELLKRHDAQVKRRLDDTDSELDKLLNKLRSLHPELKL